MITIHLFSPEMQAIGEEEEDLAYCTMLGGNALDGQHPDFGEAVNKDMKMT